MERLIPTDGSPGIAFGWDLNMLVLTGHGKERTLAEYEHLCAAAGLRLLDRHSLPLEVHVLVVEKA